MAAGFYGMCLLQAQTPTTLFRLGECLAGMGKAEEAVQLFDAAFDMARGDDQYRHVQDAAMQAVERVRSTTSIR